MVTGCQTRITVALLCSFLFTVPAHAEKSSLPAGKAPVQDPVSFIASVVSVLSGDRIEVVLPSGKQIVVVLAGLQAPAPGSLYGEISHRWLSSQLSGQVVAAECQRTEFAEYECTVFPDDRNINLVSLYHGLSVCNGRGSVLHNKSFYKHYEHLAQANKSGLWQLPSAFGNHTH